MALGPGSIAFTGFNADGNDDLAFVVLETIPAGTVIYFNDQEWQGSNFNSGEGQVTWTANAEIPAGTVVTIGSFSSSPTSSHGSVSGSSGLGNSEEAVYAYVGAAFAPTAFLAAIANDGFAISGGTLAGTGLVVGQTAIDLGAISGGEDIGAYVGPRSGETALADYAALINNAANWVTQDASGEQQADGTAPDLPFSTVAFTASPAPAPLAAGSIAFTGFNADGNDDLAFVALTTITAGTTIYFNDQEWQGSAFNTGEGQVTWTATADVVAGTVVTINNFSTTPTSAHGSVSGSSGLGNSEEIVYAYVGAAFAPTTFLAAIANDGFAISGGTLAGTGLVVGQTAIDLSAISAGEDIAVYTGARNGQSTFAGYAAAVNNAANWISQDAGGDQSADGIAPDLPFNTTAFTLGSAETQSVGFAAKSLAVGLAEGSAGATSFTFTIERTGGTTGEVTVQGSFAAGDTDAADFGGTLPGNFTATIAAGATSTTVTIQIAGDTVFEPNESFQLTLTGASNGASVPTALSASTAASGTIQNDDASPLPFGGITILDEAESLAGSTATPIPTGDLALVRLGSIQGTGGVAAGRAEALTFDAATGRVFTTNAAQNTVDVFQVGADGSLSTAGSFDLDTLPDSGTVNSVAIKNGVLAVAYESETPGQPGHVTLFDAATLAVIKTITVGVLPDQITFSPDGSKLLVANEGETLSAANNPAGGISIIDMSGGAAAATVLNTIGFGALTGSEAGLEAAGLSLFPGQAAGTDIEPEYISVSADGTRAYVTLQEVNAIAVLDLTDPSATKPLAIMPLGGVDRSLLGNAFDPNDQNGISLGNWDVKSLLQPDAIATFTVAGATYFVTANEGDARVGVTDEARLSSSSYVLDPTAYPNAAELKAQLGRLNVITTAGDTDNDGDIDQITTYGGRGISIFRQNADGTIDKVRETGGEFESIFASYYPALFNTENGANPDNRSDNKGPEPEGVSVGQVNGRTYAFVTLERIGGVMVYDLTDPANAAFVGYAPATSQDYAPEVGMFVSAADSPTGTPLFLSANEGSGTLTLYSVEAAALQTGGGGTETLTGAAGRDKLEGLDGNDRLRGFAGDDVLVGGAGNDTLEGGIGADNLQGGLGDDSYIVDSASDRVYELAGEGYDTVKTVLTSYTLDANVEVLQFTSGLDSTGTGNGLDNGLFGGAGDDMLYGLGGNDRLVGGANDDVLIGGAGRDTLEGGAGADRFVFAAGDFATVAKPDTIKDFDTASGDVIDLSSIGGLDFIGGAAFSGTAGEVRFQQIGAYTFVYGDIDGDGAADFAIQLTGAQALASDDFLL